MLVRFRSAATETITMFGDDAVQLLKLMGATGRDPRRAERRKTCRPPWAAGIRNGRDERARATPTRPRARRTTKTAASDEDNDLHRSPPIQLETRAVPLLSLLKRAAAAKAPVTWEDAKQT